MKILAIGAHPDDIELGCEGTLSHEHDSDITRLTFSGGRNNPLDQRFDTIPFLDIVQRIEKVINTPKPDFRPTIVYTHSINDLNLDHQIVARATFTACRPLPKSTVKEIYSYEVPSSTEWGFGFQPNVFVDITDTFDAKIKVLENFKKEMREHPHPRSFEAIRALAMYRGASCGVELAEAFSLVRMVR